MKHTVLLRGKLWGWSFPLRSSVFSGEQTVIGKGSWLEFHLYLFYLPFATICLSSGLGLQLSW